MFSFVLAVEQYSQTGTFDNVIRHFLDVFGCHNLGVTTCISRIEFLNVVKL